MSTEVAYCKGAFALGAACGTCERCRENLEKIKATTGLIDRSAFDSLLAAAKELRMYCLGSDVSTKNMCERFDKILESIMKPKP